MEQTNNTRPLDILKMCEKVKNMADIINFNDKLEETGGGGKTNSINTDQLMKAYNMAQKLNKILNPDENSDNQSETLVNQNNNNSNNRKNGSTGAYEASFFETGTENPALQSMKAALPYLEFRYRRNLGIFIKLIEIQKLLESYSHSMVSMQANIGGDWRKAMLNGMRPYLQEPKRKMLDTMLKIMDIREVLNNS